MRTGPLRDGHGRLIGDLRVSVTDRCNFRCQYCMPAEGLPWLEREEILRFEEIARLVAVFASRGVGGGGLTGGGGRGPRLGGMGRRVGVCGWMGVGEVRLTVAEPLVRRQFPKLVSMLRGIDGLH